MQPDSAAELAGRLNAKTNNFQRLPTGIPQYTPQDIAQALGLIKIERYRLWIHVAYGHQIQFYPDLKREILIEIVNQYAVEHWDNRPGMLGSLITTAVLEVLQSGLCFRCNGQKTVIWTPQEAQEAAKKQKQPELSKMEFKPGNCPVCDGSGMERFSNAWRARNSGMHHELYKRYWKDRYQRILDIVRQMDSFSKSVLANRLIT